MLKPIRIVLLAAALSAFSCSVSAAGEMSNYGAYAPPPSTKSESYGDTIGRKLGSGFSNIALGFLEVPKNVVNTTNEVNMAAGTTLGAVKGLIHMCGRGMAGVIDILTFPLPTEPITTPVYVWEKMDVETRYNPIFKMKN